MNPKIYLSSPHLGENEQAFVQQAFDTNWIAPLGPNVDGFEADLQSYNEIEHAAALSSGTAALHIALTLLGVGPGDVVICQSFTFCGSANPIMYLGAEPVFVDSERSTWNISPQHLEAAIVAQQAAGKRVKAIMCVHLYGMPALLDQVLEIAHRYGDIPVIEDAAESIGSTYQGKKTGTMGYMGVYSFNGNKIITTSGGGALVSSDGSLVQRARFLATQARDAAPHYQHSVIGYNYRLSNVLAGIGRGQMQVLDERIAQRRQNYQRYQDYFAGWNEKGYHIEFQEEPEGCFANRWLTCILIDPQKNKGLTRERVRLQLETDNIEARPLWKPMHLQPVFADMPFFGDGTCERLFEIGLCLPSGSNLTEDDWTRIYTQLDACLA
ncbi:MAG: DegT/DnrJ/EryC1/StrS family aminotransferase [Bernardetiaceae bacterium]